MEKTNCETYEARFHSIMELDNKFVCNLIDTEIQLALKNETKLMALHYIQKCGLPVPVQAQQLFRDRKSGAFGCLYVQDLEKLCISHIKDQFGLKAEFINDWFSLRLYAEE